MQDASAFEAARPHLIGVAYRMLGSVSEAEDVVQDAWMRWHGAHDVRQPSSWLTTVVVRLSLDRLKSARARRETYVGPWLPEPWIGLSPPKEPELASSLSFAFLRLMEALTPPQRAAFLLRDVFDQDYADIAETLQTSTSNARQLVRRARARLTGDARYTVDRDEVEALHAAFASAVRQGDLGVLGRLLADDAVAWSDGGGKASAFRRPMHGGAKIAMAYMKFASQLPPDARFEVRFVNGLPGLLTFADGRLFAVHVYEPAAGRIGALYAVLNPDKLPAG